MPTAGRRGAAPAGTTSAVSPSAQAAARSFFRKDASRLSAAEAARLAAVLPSPKRYNAARPGPYVQRRTNAIQRQMRYMGGSGYLRTLD